MKRPDHNDLDSCLACVNDSARLSSDDKSIVINRLGAEVEALRQRCKAAETGMVELAKSAHNIRARLEVRIKALEAEARAWRAGVETIRAAFGFTVGGPSAPVEIADAIKALEAERDGVIVQRDTAHQMVKTLLLYAVPKPEADARVAAALDEGFRAGWDRGAEYEDARLTNQSDCAGLGAALANFKTKR